MLRPPTLTIQMYTFAHIKEVLALKSSTRISWSWQLLLEIDTSVRRNETCTTAAMLFAYGLYCARLWHIGSLDPKWVPFGCFNNGLQPSCFISWPRIMLWVWESILVVQRPVLNVIMTRYMFSRNGFTSSRSYGHVVWCTFHRVLAEMELHKSALIEWVRMPNILIIHLGDKKKTPILAAESKAVSK